MVHHLKIPSSVNETIHEGHWRGLRVAKGTDMEVVVEWRETGIPAAPDDRSHYAYYRMDALAGP